MKNKFTIKNKLKPQRLEILCNNKKLHYKKSKIKAWCGECYQFFENSPFAKLCKNHLTKKCNVVECHKETDPSKGVICIRKFANRNSENRHTHCISEDDVKLLDENIKLQNCLGHKRESLMNIIKSKSFGKLELEDNCNENVDLQIKTINEDELNKEFEKLNDNSFKLLDDIPSNSNVGNLIQRIECLKFESFDRKYSIEDNFINKFDNFVVNSRDNNKKQNKEKTLDEFLGEIQKESKVSKNVFNKIKTLFKKNGILTVKVLKLLVNKKPNWENFIKEMKKISLQSEGISLVIETILKDDETNK